MGDLESRNLPNLIETLKNLGEKIITISCGFNHVICKTSLGKIYLWGNGEQGQLGFEENKNELIPRILLIDKKPCKAIQAKAGIKSSVILLEDRRILWWGTNSSININFPSKMNYTSLLDVIIK